MSDEPRAPSPADPEPVAPRESPGPSHAHELDAAAARAPMHAGDQAPGFVLRGQAWLQRWLSSESRTVLGVVIVILAVIVVIVLSSLQILRIFFDGLDVVALLAIFLVNWLGNGGVLVPIPGARFIGLLLIFQQAVLLPSLQVFAVAGAAMGLGLCSYYIAGARTAASYSAGDASGAEELARETGMLDEDVAEFAPGADLDAQAVSAIAGLDGPEAATAVDTGSGSAGLRHRFTSSLQQAQARAQPIIEQRGVGGMFLLCFAPSPMGTAAAYVGGLMRFGFWRYLLASFAAKFLLAGIVVALALVFSDAARAVDIPEFTLPIVDITLFEDGPPPLPSLAPSEPPTDS